MLDELRLMAIFAKTLELGSFRRAAADLKLSPSVVSHHIAQLEKRLGVTLLYRSTRKLSATHEGMQLFRSAQSMLECASQGLSAMTYYSSEPSGTLKISAPAVLARSFLIGDLAAFSKQYPKIKLIVDFSDEAKDLIREGYDLAIRIGELEDSSMKSRKIFQIKRTLVINKASYENRKPIKKPEDLREHRWIGIHMLPNYRVFTHKDGTKKKIEFDPCITVDSVEAAFQLVKSGAGFSTPPSFLVEQEGSSSGLFQLLPQWSVQSLDTYILWHPNASETALASRFKNFLLERKR